MSRILQIIEQAQSKAAERDIRHCLDGTASPKEMLSAIPINPGCLIMGNSHVELPNFGERKSALTSWDFSPLPFPEMGEWDFIGSEGLAHRHCSSADGGRTCENLLVRNAETDPIISG